MKKEDIWFCLGVLRDAKIAMIEFLTTMDPEKALMVFELIDRAIEKLHEIKDELEKMEATQGQKGG